MNFEQLLKEFIKEYYKSKNEKGFNEFRYRSSLHFLLCLEIALSSYSKKNVSYEILCDKIPRSWGSRTTILSILNHGIAENYFDKVSNQKDRRVKFYRLNDPSKLSMEKWLKNRKKLYFSEK